jgi:uncharacterized protein YndB with AHSA1/START domain
MRIALERTLPCSPVVAFSLATDPSLMNRWSTARVESTALGDADHATAVGALRRVHLPGPLGRELDEVIVASDAPDRFVYRVVPSGLLRTHRGEMRFTPVILGKDRGTRMTWTVEATFTRPGVGFAAKRFLERELARSLDRMIEVAHDGVSATNAPPRRDLSELDSRLVEGLYADAERARDDQRALADQLLGAGDPRGWFARAYEHVTDLQLDACRRGDFEHPSWVLHLVPRFHFYYVTNLEKSLGRRPGRPEEHWERAFARMRSAEGRNARFREMARSVLPGVIAHIEDDLPRALAEVYVAHYRRFCSYARFRADYLSMAPIFGRANDRLVEALDARDLPLSTRLAMLLPRDSRERRVHEHIYDIPKKRRQAFERGARIAELLLRRP